MINNPTTARASLEPIVDLFGIGVRSDAEQLVFVTEGSGEGPAKQLQELVVPDEGEIVARTRLPDHALPAFAQLDFRDQLNEHQSATASVRFLDANGSGTSFISFPGILAMSEANAQADGFLRRVWERREQVAFSLPITVQEVRVGSVVQLGDERREYIVTEIEEGLVRRLRGERIARVANAPSYGGEAGTGTRGGGTFAYGRPHVLLLDLPLVPGTEPHEQLRIAARAKPWKSQAVYCSPESTGFSLRGQIHEKATMGELVSELPASEVEGRIEVAHAPEVKLYDGELQSVSMAQLMNGANAAAVLSASGSWEVLQFQHAEEAAVDLWRLSALLRGQMGTGDAARMGASAGAPFVFLNEAVVPAGLRPEEIGLSLNWRVGPVGQDFSGVHFTSVAGEGGLRALTPLSPVHLRGWMEAGDLHLSWTRRGRMDADSWLGEDIPLGEETERYLVDVYDESGIELMRHVNTIEPRWVYPGADLIGDFGEVPTAVSIVVRQVSGSVGPGMALRRVVRLN